ncbi:hypothetical protein [Pedosphaera parvula]|uniref:Uncharacterized protein n=1 Tax=Pedosphaera parvula (strain Ellin514) TaxID=320771 RepID=B9XC20_PEDPL|nr:hypothetical protein [Pedosphaera parvula]EEF62488.1 hypothetical protein Cflav_PD5123 [Pedosphaera parvula Ellin514]
MARKLNSSEELAFLQPRSFIELWCDSEQHYPQNFRQKITRTLPELQPMAPLLQGLALDGDGIDDDWF